MMFLNNVSIRKPGRASDAVILRNLDLTIGPKERIGILAAPGSGKSTLARVLAGIEPPAAGRISATVPMSWPLGYAGFLHPNLTVAHNLGLLGQLADQPPNRYIAHVSTMAEQTEHLHKVMRDLTPTERAVLAYMCAIAVPSQMLIADDMLTVGTPDMRRKCTAIVQRRLEQGGLIYLSRNPRQLSQYCTRFFVLTCQRLIPCHTVETAQSLLTKEETHA